MTNDDCLELVLDDLVKVEFYPLSACTIPVPLTLHDVASISGIAATGSPLLTLTMSDDGDGVMDAVPTLQIKDSDTIAGRTRQHTLQCIVNQGHKAVRQKAVSCANTDIVALLTFADDSQRTIIPLPNTSNFTVTEATGSSAHTSTVAFVVQSASPLVEID